MEEDAYPSNSEKSRKHRKSNETLYTGEPLRVITAIKLLARTDWMYELLSNYSSDMYCTLSELFFEMLTGRRDGKNGNGCENISC